MVINHCEIYSAVLNMKKKFDTYLKKIILLSSKRPESIMRFCDVCNNMLYASCQNNEDTNATSLVFYCKNCNANKELTKEQMREPVVETHMVDDDHVYLQYATPNIKYDPSLPRVNNIKCPNVQCSKPSDVDHRVIYAKYDHKNMRYIYFCCHCDHFWRSKN
jgi:DNA-directed RNA polymerase subunit M/transcription elongation factor TFIIS